MTVRVICRATIRPEQQAAFERAYQTVTSKVHGAPGHVRDELLRCLDDGTTYVLLAEWESEELFRAWADDPQHIADSAPMFPFWADTFQREIHETRATLDGGGADDRHA